MNKIGTPKQHNPPPLASFRDKDFFKNIKTKHWKHGGGIAKAAQILCYLFYLFTVEPGLCVSSKVSDRSSFISNAVILANTAS